MCSGVYLFQSNLLTIHLVHTFNLKTWTCLHLRKVLILFVYFTSSCHYIPLMISRTPISDVLVLLNLSSTTLILSLTIYFSILCVCSSNYSSRALIWVSVFTTSLSIYWDI